MPPGDRQNTGGHRRRKQGGLPGRRRRVEDGIEILGKSHVEHFVRFVEHEHVKAVELQRSAPDMVERAAGRRDHDLGAALELADLPMHRRAAVDRQHRQPHAFGVLVHRFSHLHRQLAGRHENQPGGLARVALLLRDAMQHRQGKRGRLAGARRGLAQQIPPLEQQRNRFALDGSGLFVAKCRHNI